jgi:hypothetical protein
MCPKIYTTYLYMGITQCIQLQSNLYFPPTRFLILCPNIKIKKVRIGLIRCAIFLNDNEHFLFCIENI